MLTTANIGTVLYNLQSMSCIFSFYLHSNYVKKFRYNCPYFTNEAAEDSGGNRRSQGDVRSLTAFFPFSYLFGIFPPKREKKYNTLLFEAIWKM